MVCENVIDTKRWALFDNSFQFQFCLWYSFLKQNRGKNQQSDSTSRYLNNSVQSSSSTAPLWKTNNNNNGNNSSNQSTIHSHQRKTNGEASTSWPGRDSSVKYRTSISDLGSSSALVQNTNTRIKSITNRRGAVKYQK